METNAFNLCTKPNYKRNLLSRIKWWFKRRKYIKERAQNGWSRYDAWDFDTYLAHVISGALEFLANNNMSHPCDYTDKEWKKKLLEISECFKIYNTELPCPAYEEYHKAAVRARTDNCVTIEVPDDLIKAWRDEDRANFEYKMKKLKEGFDLLHSVFPNLWD